MSWKRLLQKTRLFGKWEIPAVCSSQWGIVSAGDSSILPFFFSFISHILSVTHAEQWSSLIIFNHWLLFVPLSTYSDSTYHSSRQNLQNCWSAIWIHSPDSYQIHLSETEGRLFGSPGHASSVTPHYLLGKAFRFSTSCGQPPSPTGRPHLTSWIGSWKPGLQVKPDLLKPHLPQADQYKQELGSHRIVLVTKTSNFK